MASPVVTIRPGTQDDCPAFAELLTALGQHSAHKVVLKDIDELRRDGFEGHPWYHTFVAETLDANGSQTVVGFSLYYYGYSMFNGRSVHLESLFVKDAVRGQKLGLKLWQEVVKVALTKKCKSFHVRTLETNIRALNLYKSRGTEDVTETLKVHLLSMPEPKMKEFANS